VAVTGSSLAARDESIISQLSLAVKITDRPTQTTLYRSRKAPVIYTGGSRLPGAVQLQARVRRRARSRRLVPWPNYSARRRPPVARKRRDVGRQRN